MTKKSVYILSALVSINVYSNEPEWKSELQNELKLHGVEKKISFVNDDVETKDIEFDVDIIIDDFEEVIVDIDISQDHYNPRPPLYENSHDNYYDSYMSRYLEVKKRESFCRIMASGERNKRINYWMQKSCNEELSYLPKTNINEHNGNSQVNYNNENNNNSKDYHYYHNKKIGYVFEYKSDYQFCLGISKHYRKKSERNDFMKKCSNKIETLPYLF